MRLFVALDLPWEVKEELSDLYLQHPRRQMGSHG